jgi:hypothetical protein
MTARAFAAHTARLQNVLQTEAHTTLHTIDAPHTVPPRTDMPLRPDEKPRAWFTPTRLHDGSWRYDGVHDAADAVWRAQASADADEQPYDGLIGFSQGAALGHYIAATQASQARATPFRFFMLFGGFPFRPSEPSDVVRAASHDEPLLLPSLHAFGERDTIVKPSYSRRLADLFGSDGRVVHEHGGGHVVYAGAASLAVYTSFLRAQTPREPRDRRTEP